MPQVFHQANLRTLRNTLVHKGPDVPRRVLRAFERGAEHELIADARVVGDKLFVVSCAAETFEVPFDSIKALGRIPEDQRKDFTIEEDGSYIRWDATDVDLDLRSFRMAIDPEYRAKAELDNKRHEAGFGEAIATLRQEAGLRQSDIDGLSERQVRRIEKGEPAGMAALRCLAKAHNMDLAAYLDRLAEESAQGLRAGRSSAAH